MNLMTHLEMCVLGYIGLRLFRSNALVRSAAMTMLEFALVIFGATQQRDLPNQLGPLSAPRDPPDNIATPAKVALGQQLYFDPRLSGDGKLSCASCHDPQKGFSDGLPTARGFKGKKLGRASPTVFNSAFYRSWFWDGRSTSLEAQALGPMLSPDEMKGNEAEIVSMLKSKPEYVASFQSVFESEPSLPLVAKAIAAYERSLWNIDSPFDRYARGDDNAISISARRGLDVFVGNGRCVLCHMGANFSDSRFHNIGTAKVDRGREAVTGNAADKGAFRTPTLRNIALTAPYMHDGSSQTLKEVIKRYETLGAQRAKNPSMSPLLMPILLKPQERIDLEAFLLALTGDPLDSKLTTKPELPK